MPAMSVDSCQWLKSCVCEDGGPRYVKEVNGPSFLCFFIYIFQGEP